MASYARWRNHGRVDQIDRFGKVFHDALGWMAANNYRLVTTRGLSYRFYPHFHPYVTALLTRLLEKRLRGFQAIDTETKLGPDGNPQPVLYDKLFSSKHYAPSVTEVHTPEALQDPEHPRLRVESPYPIQELDFKSHGAYSVYNWELFFHVPLTVALHLSKNQRFEEAQRWLHFIFDPTDDSDGPTPERFWKVKPFQTNDVALIQEVLVNLSSRADSDLLEDTEASIDKWRENPFRPHAVARYRPWAYMMKAVMAYLDNLIAWGDNLFRQDTGESINEATQIYVMAANLLGPRPQSVPKKGSIKSETYASLRPKLDKFSNALVEFETDIPFDALPPPGPSSDPAPLAPLHSVGGALFFCVPHNEKLLSYWDTVADRLFKIRNSLNILGIFRQLPLFEPPIDPGMLARAAAAGLDVGAVVSGANQPLPLVRFQVLAQKAAEVCQEVKSLGAQILAAIEKEDNEALAVLRARHDRIALGLAESVKYAQWQEAIKAREGLERSLERAFIQFEYHERLLGRSKEDIEGALPELTPLERAGLEKARSAADFSATEPVLSLREIGIDVSGETGGKKINAQEASELRAWQESTRRLRHC